jgi:hypothetical protein
VYRGSKRLPVQHIAFHHFYGETIEAPDVLVRKHECPNLFTPIEKLAHQGVAEMPCRAGDYYHRITSANR